MCMRNTQLAVDFFTLVLDLDKLQFEKLSPY